MSTIRSKDGGVASGHPLAAAAGVRALADGGTAIDAALAAAFTQWVVSAPLCGAGGDLVALVVDGGTVTVYAGWARVPLGLDPSVEIVASGPRAAVVPAALRGAEALWKAGGRLPWARLFEDGLVAAIGHEVTPFMAKVYAECERKGHGHTPGRVNDQPGVPAVGATISTSRLAATLSRIAAGGADAFYSGPIREAIVEAAAADGAWLAAVDLDGVEAFVGPAKRADLGDSELFYPAWPSQALITAELLATVEPQLDPAGFEFADRLAAMIEELLIRRCMSGYAGTAVSVAADGEGRSVALVHSLAGTQYGTGWVAGETGVALGNRVGTALSTRPDLPAANPVPGAVVPHTLSCAHVRRGGEQLTIATPGGDRQVQWLSQAVQRFRRDGSADEIASGPRWFVCPDDQRFGVPAGIGKPWYIYGEPGIEWVGRDRVGGYDVRTMENVGGGVQLVMSDADDWVLASDRHTGGAAQARVRDVS